MICTFYSYKGGVGRSMAVANVADAMARRGLRTAIVDFDLEAPGLEKFFLRDALAAQRNLGLLDLLVAYKRAMSAPPMSSPEDRSDDFRRLESYLVPIYHQLPSGGTLDLLTAGQRGDDEQLSTYAYHLRSFDWQGFYFEWSGELFFQWLRRELLRRYDLIIVDSRTGVTEMGGVCAYQLADAVVMFCAANSQNVQGTLDVIRNFQSPRVRALRKDRPLEVVVVPARVQQNALDVKRFQEAFETSFVSFTPRALTDGGHSMWKLMIPYDASYAFEERLVGQRQNGTQLRGAIERLADTLQLLASPGSKLGSLVTRDEQTATDSPALTREPPAEPVYDPTQPFAGYDAFLSYNPTSQKEAEHLVSHLQKRGLRVWFDVWNIKHVEHWRRSLEGAMQQSQAFVVLLGPTAAEGQRVEELELILQMSYERTDIRLVPVLLPGAIPETVPTFLRSRVWVDFRTGLDDPQALDALVAGIQGRAAPAPSMHIEQGPNPYKGMAPFEEDDAPLFFGRERETREILRCLLDHNFVAIVGASGSGKSSLLRARVIPELRQLNADLKVAVMRPGPLPFVALADAMANLPLAMPSDPAHVLRDDPALFGALVTASLSSPVVLLIDQLEELWRVEDPVERVRFMSVIRLAIERSTGLFRVISVLRADFYGLLLEDGAWTELLSTAQVNIGPLSIDEQRAAIEGPAKFAGFALEPGLVDRLLDDAASATTPLPLLQFVLARLWERSTRGFITHEEYDAMGGMGGAVASSADRVYASLSSAEQVVAQKLLLQLVTAEGRLRSCPINELSPDARSILDRFAVASLVVVDRVGSFPVATLAHEALAIHWPRLRAWVEDLGESLRIRDRLQQVAAEWADNRHAPEYLYRGMLLGQAEALAASDPGAMSSQAAEFVSASVALRDREDAMRLEAMQLQAMAVGERQRTRAMMLAFALTVLVVLALILWTAITRRG